MGAVGNVARVRVKRKHAFVVKHEGKRKLSLDAG
jgi:hypothetical protein